MDSNMDFVSQEEYETRLVGFEVDCNEGKGDMLACQRVGEYFSLVKEDYKKAADIFTKNCDDRSFAPSCFNLARLMVAGKGVSQSDSKGLKNFVESEKACDAGHQPACFFLAQMLQYPEDRKENGEMVDFSNVDKKVLDETRANAYVQYEKNCNNGDYESCFYAGNNYLYPLNPNRDPVKAEKYLKIACDKNHVKSCHNLAVMYRNGDKGVPKNEKKFQEYKALTEELIKSIGGAMKGGVNKFFDAQITALH